MSWGGYAPAPWSKVMLSGRGNTCVQFATSLSAKVPCDAPKTLSPGLNGHPLGIGESAAIFPANSEPRMKGSGGWF